MNTKMNSLASIICLWSSISLAGGVPSFPTPTPSITLSTKQVVTTNNYATANSTSDDLKAKSLQRSSAFTSAIIDNATPSTPVGDLVFDLGQSMDGLRHLPVVNRCIDTAHADLKSSSHTIDTKRFVYEVAKTRSELVGHFSRTQSGDVSGSYGIYSGSAKHDRSVIRNTQNISEKHAIFMHFENRYLQENSGYVPLENLNPHYQEVLATEGVTRFRTLCGDGYVGYVVYGTSAKLTLQIESNEMSSETIKSKTTSLEAAMEGYGSAGYTDEEKSIMRSKFSGLTFKVSAYSVGIATSISGTTDIEGVMNYINQLENTNANVKQPIEYQVVQYDFSGY